jgi:hypothetical protein
MHVDRRVLRVSRPVNGWTLTTVAAELLPGFTKSFAQQAMLRAQTAICARDAYPSLSRQCSTCAFTVRSVKHVSLNNPRGIHTGPPFVAELGWPSAL